jgi:ectonucleotide pyrophosphatase/phosphodiesterase family protein 5
MDPVRWIDAQWPARADCSGLDGGRACESPPFVTLYFNDVDHLSHEHGPDSQEARAALRTVDAAIGELVEGLDRLHQAANIVVVSDHGMATVPPGNRIALDEIAPAPMYRVVYYGAIAGLEPVASRDAELSALLPGRHGHVGCWRREALPARFSFGRNPRVPAFICLADVGWIVQPFRPEPGRERTIGAHGYDNAAPVMRAVFIAAGPDFARNRVIPPIDNTEVAPLLKALLRLGQQGG